LQRGLRITIWDVEGIGYILKQRNQSWWLHDLAKVCGRGSLDNWFDNNIEWIIGDDTIAKF